MPSSSPADFGASNASYWEVTTLEAGRYDITLDFQRPLEDARATLRIGEHTRVESVPAGATTLLFEDVDLPADFDTRLGFEVEQIDMEEGHSLPPGCPPWLDSRGENLLEHPAFKGSTLWCVLRRVR